MQLITDINYNHMKPVEEYLSDRIVILGCIDKVIVHEQLMMLQEIDNPFKAGPVSQRFSKNELVEVG